MAVQPRRRMSRTGTSGRQGVRRANVWCRNSYILGTQTQDAGFDLLDDLDPGSVLGSTVIRIRGTIAFEIGANQINNFFLAAFVVSERETDYLNPSVNPGSDRNDFDWMYWKVYRQYGIKSTIDTYVESFEVDVKAQRKIVAPNQTLNFFWTASEPISEVRADFSTLVKLS